MIDLWFPTPIFVQTNLIDDKENMNLSEHIMYIEERIEKGENWNTGINTSHGTYDMMSDPLFNNLLKNVTIKVNEFGKELGSTYNYSQCEYAWYNVYRQGDFQEFHTHAGSVFSAVYFVTNPKDSGRLIFQSPNEPDMCPVKDVKTDNHLNFGRCHYNPDPGTLIIFRSFLKHCVEKCYNVDPRITIAFNY